MSIQIENKNAKTVNASPEKNPRILYEHQEDAMREMGLVLEEKNNFRSILVLPTGGGKTLTAVYWLIKNAIDKDKKILWIAHRHLLLEQAAEAFESNAYIDGMLLNRRSYKYRVISGIHDKPIHINSDDDILIVGKDSIVRSLDMLNKWLKGQDVFLVIDEAHHSVAKSYKAIVNHVEDNSANMKLLGLTATPFRTSEKEKGALLDIFSDDIVYKIDLEKLITNGILAKPVFEEYDTKILLGNKLGLKALKSIENLDIIPEDIAEEIVINKDRNKFIVSKYFESYRKYGPTLVFALNQKHAITLKALFDKEGEKYGIKSDFVISGVKDMNTGVVIANKDNQDKIKKFRKGEIRVLINVNILTEGTDLPKTQTVFLTRPTVSTVLMTQMVGRALRGERAGGTSNAYIVSFVDDWNSKIAWINPEALLDGEIGEVTSGTPTKNDYRLIAIAKIEEFARLIDDTVDTGILEGISCIERIPLGMYIFSFIDSNNGELMERNHQILIYNSTKPAYVELIRVLPDLFNEFDINEETIPEDKLKAIMQVCEECYFTKDMIPSYNPKNIEYLLKFYAQKETEPLFIKLEDIDREKLDLSKYAKVIKERDMRRSEEREYIESLWNEKDSILPIYYSNIYFFKKMIQKEIDKLYGDIIEVRLYPVSESEKRDISKYPLDYIIKNFPNYGLELKEKVFKSAIDDRGIYKCNKCGYSSKLRRYLQIDHIKPMSKGGLTVIDNLQVLCRSCNARKGDKE